MRKLAIINCKAKKKDYKCPASEMYSDSPQFKHQMGFIREYYNDYKILSVKYGVIDKTDVVEPYNLTLTKQNNINSANPTITPESLRRWSTMVKKQISKISFEYDEIHLHLSQAYLHEIQEVLGIPNVIYVKIPNVLELGPNYGKATQLYKQNGDVFIDVVSSYKKWLKSHKHELFNKKHMLPWNL